MIKTGNTFIDTFSLAVVFFPFFPVAVILIRKSFDQRDLNLLVTLCLLNFMGGFCLLQFGESPAGRNSALHVFSLLETVILLYLLKSGFSLRQQAVIQFLAIAFLSAATTYLLLERPEFPDHTIERIEHGAILLLASFSMMQLVRSYDLRIFSSPLFWIAAGTLFYFFVLVLLESVESFQKSGRVSFAQGVLLADISALVRYLLYILGCMAGFHTGKTDRPE